MNSRVIKWPLMLLIISFAFAPAFADEYADTVKVFRGAGESGTYFAKSYGYAVFPTIGKGGLGIGGAYGSGRVFTKGKYVGDTSMSQVTVGLQMGGQAYSEIIFFEDKRAFDEFTSGTLSSALRRLPPTRSSPTWRWCCSWFRFPWASAPRC